jgi:hypothetical protein
MFRSVCAFSEALEKKQLCIHLCFSIVAASPLLSRHFFRFDGVGAAISASFNIAPLSTAGGTIVGCWVGTSQSVTQNTASN